MSSMCSCYFGIISPWIRKCQFIWTNLNPLHQRMLSLCKVWLKLALWFWGRFLNVANWKRVMPFIWSILNPFYPWVYVLVTSSRNTELFQTFYEKNLNFIHDTMIIQVNVLILQFCAKSCMFFFNISIKCKILSVITYCKSLKKTLADEVDNLDIDT